jgi:Holliday junction resolvasome RuvABC ATP-dependent DNA helicase subunit
MQDGQHVIIFGERGVGKTSLANVLSKQLELTEEEKNLGPIISPIVNCDTNDTFSSVWKKALDLIELSKSYQPIGFGVNKHKDSFCATKLLKAEYHHDNGNPKEIDPNAVMTVLAKLAKQCVPILIIDEFDRLEPGARKAFADLIKMVSDHSIPATIVLVGVADTVEGLLADHESISRNLVQVRMPRMTVPEIREILIRGTRKLTLLMDESVVRRIAAISQGLPYYAHLLALHATREALKKSSTVVTDSHLRDASRRATDANLQTLEVEYHNAIRSPQQGNLFGDVLLACAMAKADELGYFMAADVRTPLAKIAGRLIAIPTFAQHLREFSGKRGKILTVTGESRRLTYHFRNPLMQPFVLMQGEATGRLPADFAAEEG